MVRRGFPHLFAACGLVAACGGGGSTSSGAPGSPPPPINRQPSIVGSPSTSAIVGTAYAFMPQASDPDGQRLTFTVTNRPGWASFDAGTGRLYGTPASGDVGIYQGISVTASDGSLSASLPQFTIVVISPQPGAATVGWTPPMENEDGSAFENPAGYRIHYGTGASDLLQQMEIADAAVTSATVNNLAPGTWYFGVTAYTTAGVESRLSEIKSKTIN